LRGHAIEVRLYAENPERGFLPSTGTLHGLHLPAPDQARVDTGVRERDAVTPLYDPLIGKIIAWGEDREAARARLQRALADTAILGVATNLGFLHRAVGDPDFAAANIDTGFIDRRRDALLPPPQPVPDLALAAAALSRSLGQAETSAGSPAADRFTPWARLDGWRLNGEAAPQTLVFRHADEELTVTAIADGAGWRLRLGGRDCHALAERRPDGLLAVTLDGRTLPLRVLEHDAELAVFLAGESWHFTAVDPLLPPPDADAGAGRLTAPMPGRVIQLLVAPGEAVRRGQPMMVIEAMKMEHTIAAPRDGVVEAVHYRAGDPVEEGAELIALAESVEAKSG
jgi:3-methylcrotonyl-CoA carboxylase alpha subunit